MKYVLMFTSRPDLDDAVDPELSGRVYQQIFEWFTEHGSQITEQGAELHPVSSATTVKHGDGGPVVVDGPFNEAKEVIGGFTVIDVPDLDAAVALGRSWPMLQLPGNAVEIRPVVEDYSQFENAE